MSHYSHPSFFSRLFKFFKGNVLKNFPYFVTYLFLFFRKNAVKEGRSLIRFGDGEVHIMNYGSIHYENFNSKLRATFLKIIKEYTNNSNYVLGLNTWALEKTNSYLKEKGQFYCWLPLKANYVCIFPKGAKYFDASLFYRKNVFEKYVLPHLLDKHIVLISRKDNCTHIKNTLFFDFISYVVTPDFHSYTQYEEIVSETDKVIQGIITKKIVLLVACGPASKAICYEYSCRGIQAIDVGRGLELIGTDTDLEHMLL